MKKARLHILLLAVFCIAWGLISFYYAAFNYWVAGGPPVESEEIYEWRGNLWAASALLCLGILALLVMKLFLSRRKNVETGR